MEHAHFRDRISRYVDNELKPQEAAEVRAHLESCAECRALFDDLNRLEKLVKEKSSFGDSDYWENLAVRTERQIDEANRPKRESIGGSWMRLAAVAATLVIVGTVAVHEWRDFNLLPPDIPSESQKLESDGALEEEIVQTLMESEKHELIETPSPDAVDEKADIDTKESKKGRVGQEATQGPERYRSQPEQEAGADQPVEPLSVAEAPVLAEDAVFGRGEGDLSKSIDIKTAPGTDSVASYLDKVTPDKLKMDQVQETAQYLQMAKIAAVPAETTVADQDMSDDFGFDDWRLRRDSLLIMWRQDADQPKAKSSMQATSGQSTGSRAERVSLGLKMLEAQYRVASITNDAGEREEIERFFDSLAAGDGNLAGSAATYLKALRTAPLDGAGQSEE